MPTGSPPTPLTVPLTSPTGSGGALWNLAQSIGHREEAAGSEQANFLTNIFNQTSAALDQPIRKDLLFSQAADQVGLRARGAMDRMRTSLGARGIDPSSGAASGLLGRLMMQNQNALIGAQRDIDIADAQQRYANAAQKFGMASNLAQARNEFLAPSMVPLDTATNLEEMQLAREGLAMQAKSQNKASKNNLLGGIISGGLGLLGSIL